MVKAECREVNFKSRVFDGRGEVGTKVAEGERGGGEWGSESRSGGTGIYRPDTFGGWMVRRPGPADGSDVLLVWGR